MARTLETLHTAEAVRRISEAGGLAVAVRPEDRAADEALRRTPVVDVAITEAIGRRRGRTDVSRRPARQGRLPSPASASSTSRG